MGADRLGKRKMFPTMPEPEDGHLPLGSMAGLAAVGVAVLCAPTTVKLSAGQTLVLSCVAMLVLAVVQFRHRSLRQHLQTVETSAAPPPAAFVGRDRCVIRQFLRRIACSYVARP